MRIKRRNSLLKAEIQDICVFKRFLCLLFPLSQHFPFSQLPENRFLSRTVSQKGCVQPDPFTCLRFPGHLSKIAEFIGNSKQMVPFRDVNQLTPLFFFLFFPTLSNNESASKFLVLYTLSCDGKSAAFPGLVRKTGSRKADSCLGSTTIPEALLDKLGSKSDLRSLVKLMERHRSSPKDFITIKLIILQSAFLSKRR